MTKEKNQQTFKKGDKLILVGVLPGGKNRMVYNARVEKIFKPKIVSNEGDLKLIETRVVVKIK